METMTSSIDIQILGPEITFEMCQKCQISVLFFLFFLRKQVCGVHTVECTVESTVWSPRCSGGRRPLRRNLDLHESGKVEPMQN